ncbi:hypothetical protein QFC22_001591 [Naganishia vaughanmartiniae]|uniref:Uncharacterized protein n=1 Tax=Naganishia vaughanmartiniae TaxID=1424756 RepID=A0ACC2XL02_9TREE|nr:hypothetical protein QFC22_001591 [Naganishia vaughanmartiniae]
MVIVDQQGSAPIEQPNGLLRADTFGNLNKHVSSDEGVASGSDRQGSEKQTISDVQHVEVEETLHTAPIKTTATASLPAETTTPVPEPSKTTAAFFSSFVSPFDAFDPPPPTMTANSTSGPDGANSKKKSKKDKAAVKIGEKAVAAELKNTKVPAPKAASENVEKKEKAAQASVLASESRGSTQTTTSIPVNTLPLPAKKPVKQEDIPVVYRSSAFIDPSQPTSAATIPAAEWLYDMSEPHADSLVHIPKPYEERRISNIKTHVMTTGLSAGSVLRASVNLLAYVLPKGKARVVNQDTAGNTLIALADFGDNSSQPPSQQQPVAVIDLALTDKWVVLLGEDGSFGVWRVDTGSDGQSMACHPEFFRGVSARGREVKRVDLIDVNGVVTLVMMTDEMVASVAVEELAEANEADDWIQLMDVTYEETFSVGWLFVFSVGLGTALIDSRFNRV